MRVSGEIPRDAAVIGNGTGSGSICQASRDRRMPTSERLLQAAVDQQVVVCDPRCRLVMGRHGRPSSVDSNLAAVRSGCVLFSARNRHARYAGLSFGTPISLKVTDCLAMSELPSLKQNSRSRETVSVINGPEEKVIRAIKRTCSSLDDSAT